MLVHDGMVRDKMNSVSIDYVVRTYQQVLFSGTWEVGYWDWEIKEYHFPTMEKAEEYLNTVYICPDLSIARIYKVTKTIDDYFDMDLDEELLVEKNSNDESELIRY